MICPVCQEDKDESKFHYNKVGPKAGMLRHSACYRCRGLKERAQLKLDFIKAFDYKCSCCGENDPRFLTLDHVKDDGNEHREKYNEQQIMRIAKKEGYPKDRYTCLCFNCNSGRAANGGICPHKCITREKHLEDLEARVYYLGRQHVKYNTSNLPEARKQLKKNRELAKTLQGFTQDQLDAIVASITR